MKKRESEARGKIIGAATDLITEQGCTETVTTRDIATRAGVGIGLVNYHFQTKENLFDICVEKIMGNAILELEAYSKSMEAEPIDKLRFLLKSTARFFSQHPGISRASISADLLSGTKADNTSNLLSAYLPCVSEVCAGKATETEMRVVLHLILSALQAAFLRGEAFGGYSGFDFSNDMQRDQLVDILLYVVLRKYM